MINESEHHKPSNPTQGIFKDVDPVLATLSAVIIFAFVLIGAIAPEFLSNVFQTTQNWLQSNMNWYYVLATAVFTVVVFWLIFSKHGKIVLGQDGDKPEFSTFSWFAMLFGTSMGIGLLFWSISEPLYHMQDNPFLLEGEAQTMIGAHKGYASHVYALGISSVECLPSLGLF